jgi:hypothetical protein
MVRRRRERREMNFFGPSRAGKALKGDRAEAVSYSSY